MFKFLICFIILVSITLNESKFLKKGNINDNSISGESSWPNLWFPHPSNYEDKVKIETNKLALAPEKNVTDLVNTENSSNYTGLWFPHPPKYQSTAKPEIVTTVTKTNVRGSSDKSKPSNWTDLYFPFPPNYGKNSECDDGKYNISVDFDPEDKRHSFNYLCIGKRSEYEPNMNTSALMKAYVIPTTYEPPIKCLNENIKYSESIPTYGAFRPMAPKFGSYNYLPPQRWLHSLADGAIVLLYHPCAFAGQIEQLKNTLKGCLYRHIITPSQQLTPQRPLALIAWGKSLEMSVVYDDIVINFIKQNAKIGFAHKLKTFKKFNKLYDADLLNEAHLVTDEQDVEICGYKEMR